LEELVQVRDHINNDAKEAERGDMDCIHLALNKDQRWDELNRVMNHAILQKTIILKSLTHYQFLKLGSAPLG
jgi:hypothetical protein